MFLNFLEEKRMREGRCVFLVSFSTSHFSWSLPDDYVLVSSLDQVKKNLRKFLKKFRKSQKFLGLKTFETQNFLKFVGFYTKMYRIEFLIQTQI